MKHAKADIKAASRSVKKGFSKAKAKIIKAERDAEKYARNNPKKAAAIAAGVGIAVGAALTALYLRHKNKK